MTQQQLTTSQGEQLGRFLLRPPQASLHLDQDEEWCEVQFDGKWRRIRFHDYHEIYSVPGLYETLFARRLKCCSPERIVDLIDDVLADHPESFDSLRILDMGAGNGMVGEALQKAGAPEIHGIDILPEARMAALRDRPGVYENYYVSDLTDPTNPDYQKILAARLNTLTLVAALGYGDIPPAAFVQACNLIATPGWLAFNIKEDFLDEDIDGTGFCALIRRLRKHGYLQVEAYRRYRHRMSISNQPLYYIAMVAKKLRQIPETMLR